MKKKKNKNKKTFAELFNDTNYKVNYFIKKLYLY